MTQKSKNWPNLVTLDHAAKSTRVRFRLTGGHSFGATLFVEVGNVERQNVENSNCRLHNVDITLFPNLKLLANYHLTPAVGTNPRWWLVEMGSNKVKFFRHFVFRHFGLRRKNR
jgi:hypothetical protein